MLKHSNLIKLVCLFIIHCLLLTGCSMMTPAKKPDIGPAGKPVEAKPNPPFAERFVSPPEQLYNLEATAGVIFEGINQANWSQAQDGISTLQSTWQQSKPLIGEKKGVKEADEALGSLIAAVAEKRTTDSYSDLNKFMGSISDIGKSYKLSPLADIIAVDNAIRDVSFYVEDHNWHKAAAKVKALDGAWKQGKPSLEQLGILGEITRTHAIVNQIKDAVDGESKAGVEAQLANINESMGRIREFYRGK